VYDDQLLFNWQNVFWGANTKLAQLQVCTRSDLSVVCSCSNVHRIWAVWLWLPARPHLATCALVLSNTMLVSALLQLAWQRGRNM
jgi:hypothetical protein